MGISSGTFVGWLFLHCVQIKLEFENEDQCTPRKTSWSRDKNKQQTQPTYDIESSYRIEPWPHWWEVSALTTVPSSPPSTLPPKSGVGRELCFLILHLLWILGLGF